MGDSFADLAHHSAALAVTYAQSVRPSAAHGGKYRSMTCNCRFAGGNHRLTGG